MRFLGRHKGRRDASNELCFPVLREALCRPPSVHRRPLCRRIIGFSHDDKFKRSQPAIVKSVIVLDDCRVGENPGRSPVSAGAITPATGCWFQLSERREGERLFPGRHYFHFGSLKRGLGRVAFLSFYESGCLKDTWSVCSRSSQRESNESTGTLRLHPDVAHYSQCEWEAC